MYTKEGSAGWIVLVVRVEESQNHRKHASTLILRDLDFDNAPKYAPRLRIEAVELDPDYQHTDTTPWITISQPPPQSGMVFLYARNDENHNRWGYDGP